MDLRKESQWIRNNLKETSMAVLKKAYLEVSCALNYKHRFESDRTPYENIVYKALKTRTRLEIQRSYWIGNRNMDFFIPGVRGNEKALKGITTKGLVIEVDGGVHNDEVKMKRDESKFDFLLSLGIMSTTIPNEDINHPLILSLIVQIGQMKPIDCRAKERLLRNIYLSTIVSQRQLILDQEMRLPKSILAVLGLIEMPHHRNKLSSEVLNG